MFLEIEEKNKNDLAEADLDQTKSDNYACEFVTRYHR